MEMETNQESGQLSKGEMRWVGPGGGSGDGEEQTDLKESLKWECLAWMWQ